MTRSVGIFDSLFGEKLIVDLPDGTRATVTRKWLRAQQRNATFVSPTAKRGFTGDASSELDRMIHAGGTYSLPSYMAIKQGSNGFQVMAKNFDIDHFFFLFTIAFVYVRICGAGKFMPQNQVIELQNGVASKLENWRDDAEPAFADLDQFLEIQSELPFEGKIGYWIMWNATGEQPACADSIECCVDLGRFLCRSIAEYAISQQNGG